MKGNKKDLLKIFTTFFKIGAFTFGGGYAMIPLIQQEAVEHHGWVSDDDIMEIVAIAESTPGPIAINSATFIGYQTCGVLGSVCATLGVVLPSFIIILIISSLLQHFHELAVVQYAFRGIRAGVLALLMKALLKMYKKDKRNWVSYVIMAGAFVLTSIFNVSVLPVLVGCALFGYIASRTMEKEVKK